jgi:Holliday junction resolvase RusA-like endonuclease
MGEGLKIVVYGKPIGQARPRFFTRKGKNGKTFAGAFNPQESEAVKFGMSVRSQLPAGFVPMDGPIAISARFVVPIPASATKKKRAAMADGTELPAKRPDLDNYLKFLKDSLSKVVWSDDSQVCRFYEPCEKVYGEIPRTEIEVFKL